MSNRVIQTYRHTDGRILTEVGDRWASNSRPATEAEAAEFLAAESGAPARDPSAEFVAAIEPAPEPAGSTNEPPAAVVPTDAGSPALAAPEQPKRGPGRPRTRTE